MPSAVAWSVCVPETVPSVQPPELASPAAVVRTESLTTLPPPAVTRQRTMTLLMALPLASSTFTDGIVLTTVATVAAVVRLVDGVVVVGTCGSPPQAVPTREPNASELAISKRTGTRRANMSDMTEASV